MTRPVVGPAKIYFSVKNHPIGDDGKQEKGDGNANKGFHGFWVCLAQS